MKQIPNMLSCLRLLMIPAFVMLYFKNGANTLAAASIYILAWATDVLDGYLARRNNWITDLGKILDPLADKLMQFAAVTCLVFRDRIFLFMLVPLVIKELGMLIGALLIMRTQKVVEPSHWYGKFSTVLIFLCTLALLIWRESTAFDTVLCFVMLAAMLFALAMYYFMDFRGKYKLSFLRKQRGDDN